MDDLKKPYRLKQGDKIAAVTLSWGGPGKYPYRYQVGKAAIEKYLGLEVVEMKNTLADPDWIRNNPEARAYDLMQAFSDSNIKGIFSTIGGDDSIRVLKYLDPRVIIQNPKVFMGYSDTTASHMFCYKSGLISHYGPSVMAGFGENVKPFKYMIDSVYRTIFCSDVIGEICPAAYFTDEFLDWENPMHQKRSRQINKNLGWKVIQGNQKVMGRLLGGNLEILNMLKGTEYFPKIEDFNKAIMYLEYEDTNIVQIEYFLRSCGVCGIFDKIYGIIWGRPRGMSGGNDKILEDVIKKVIVNEFGKGDMPIMINMDFGHTDPMFVIPNGVMSEVDPINSKFTILESAVSG